MAPDDEDEEDEDDDDEEADEKYASMQAEQKEWRQERVLTGRVKMSKHTGHVREDLSSSNSFLRAAGPEDSQPADMVAEVFGQGGERKEDD